ncbi:hypothetical protein LTY36_08140 [Limosilactobacillus agrestis]|uniref:Uncharacterized protein n=1 Tax=Limosilactobacillus agrestis TaxID=2759748 RepID=A0A7W3YLF1_9LACO|nr:hypothetical protein [Limosilactobacillus agrestis]MBB1096299.1 hypothetical protein [Limosilactobacillus agrestis]MCD7131157.1 hypothetical protein [Limosilactobacillus agrestis]
MKITVKSYIKDHRHKRAFARDKCELLKSIALTNSHTRVHSYGDYNLVVDRKHNVLDLDDGVADRIIDNIPLVELERFIGKWNDEQTMIIELRALADKYWRVSEY